MVDVASPIAGVRPLFFLTQTDIAQLLHNTRSASRESVRILIRSPPILRLM
jgi:hypothetical protein